MCPAQGNLLINYFLQLFRRFFLRSVWLGPGIREEILTVPGHTHACTPCVLRHEQLSPAQQSEEWENSEETRRTQCGRGFAERKKSEREKDKESGKWEEKEKEEHLVSVSTVSGLRSLFYAEKWTSGQMRSRGCAITVSDRNSTPQHTLTMQQGPNSMAPSLHYEPDLELRTVSMFSSH